MFTVTSSATIDRDHHLSVELGLFAARRACKRRCRQYQTIVLHDASPASPIHFWLYVSHCLLPPTGAAAVVADIVRMSRVRNAELGVTGALLFNDPWFAQYLEGPEDAVAVLRTSIGQDLRHTGIATVAEGRQSHRLFEDWSLAYAGTSMFVSRRLEAALAVTPRSADELLDLLREFATPAAD